MSFSPGTSVTLLDLHITLNVLVQSHAKYSKRNESDGMKDVERVVNLNAKDALDMLACKK